MLRIFTPECFAKMTLLDPLIRVLNYFFYKYVFDFAEITEDPKTCDTVSFIRESCSSPIEKKPCMSVTNAHCRAKFIKNNICWFLIVYTSCSKGIFVICQILVRSSADRLKDLMFVFSSDRKETIQYNKCSHLWFPFSVSRLPSLVAYYNKLSQKLTTNDMSDSFF